MIFKFPFLKDTDTSIKAVHDWARQIVNLLNRAKIVEEPVVTGSMMLWPAALPVPDGWLAADGATLDRDKYRKLFLAYQGSGMTFTLPNEPGPTPGTIVMIKA